MRGPLSRTPSLIQSANPPSEVRFVAPRHLQRLIRNVDGEDFFFFSVRLQSVHVVDPFPLTAASRPTLYTPGWFLPAVRKIAQQPIACRSSSRHNRARSRSIEFCKLLPRMLPRMKKTAFRGGRLFNVSH